MRQTPRETLLPRQTPLTEDVSPLVDLARVPNDADDRSDEDRPTTDHEAKGWRATPPVKP